MNYKIEKMKTEDAIKLHEFYVGIAKETNFVSFEKEEAASVEDCKKIISSLTSPNFGYCIKDEDGDYIASISSYTNSHLSRERHKSIFGVAVRKKYWGRGLATVLMNKLIEESKNQNISKVCLVVSEDNHSAISLYKKYNFVTEGVLKDDMLINGVMETGISMALFL